MVTARILSNIEVHGIGFALDSEARHLMRKGYSRHTSYIMANAMPQAVIKL